ncbi:hypothetical protein [Marinobacter shengliensis]
MTKKIGMMRKTCLGAVIGGFALGMGNVSAEQFDVTAEVQNTLAITVVQPMSWGTLFAADAVGTAVSGLTMAANGDITTATAQAVGTGDANDAPSFLSLGGATSARGSVAAGNNEFTITVPSFDTLTLVASSAAFTTTNAVELRIAGGDPNVARFYMVDFVVGDEVGATVVDNADSTYTFTPSFGVTDVEFGIGATIYTDGSGTRTQYQTGTYEGEFTVTASY